MHIIYRFINDRAHYWDTCGWTRNLRTARRYCHSEAREALAKMSRAGLRVMIAPFKKGAGVRD